MEHSTISVWKWVALFTSKVWAEPLVNTNYTTRVLTTLTHIISELSPSYFVKFTTSPKLYFLLHVWHEPSKVLSLRASGDHGSAQCVNFWSRHMSIKMPLSTLFLESHICLRIPRNHAHAYGIHTRLNIPFAIAAHLFFVPVWVLSL